MEIYQLAKKKLSQVRSITAIGLVGRHRLLNANFYGMFRYVLFSLLPDPTITKYIMSDARKFLWKRDPELVADELGSSGTIGKWINKESTNTPKKRKGGALDDPQHVPKKKNTQSHDRNETLTLSQREDKAMKNLIAHILDVGGELLQLLSPLISRRTGF